METTLGVLARHALLVLVAAIVRKRTTIVAGCVELQPADDPKTSDSRNVRQQTGRLLDIDAVLTLVPGYRLKTCPISQLAQLRKLSNARWGASVGSAKVFRMLKY